MQERPSQPEHTDDPAPLNRQSSSRDAIVEARRVAAEYAIFAEIGRVISSSPDIQDVYEGFAAQVRNVMPFERLVINSVDLKAGTVTTLYQSGTNIPEWAPGMVRALANSPTEWIAKNARGLLFTPDSPKSVEETFANQSPVMVRGLN